MKQKVKFYALIVLCSLLTGTIDAQDEEMDAKSLAGDHLSLAGALSVFQESKSPEDFEKNINSEKQRVNNIDLNEDGQTDYIRVVDFADENNHALVLRIDVSEDETQDVAVIEIEKTGAKEAILQIVGDEDLYGYQKIVEPYQMESNRRGVNVWGWTSVRFVYRPSYRPWISPWRFGVRPRWWRPWNPRPLNVYIGYRRPWTTRFHVVKTHRVWHAHRLYIPKRKHSVIVKKRFGKSMSQTTRVQTSHSVTVKQPTKKVKVVKQKKTSVSKNRNKVVRGKKTVKKAKVRKG